MKVVIFAGGHGTRLGEETTVRPKPILEIGDKPILWHIMKIYSHYGFNDFVILLGYKGYLIKEYFANYLLHQSNCFIDLEKNNIQILNNQAEPWKITLLDTGLNTMTAGRLRKAKPYLEDKAFFLTYGDGVSNVDIKELLKFHNAHGQAVTMTSVRPEGRFGIINVSDDQRIESFQEKPKAGSGWINGGFFVCNSNIFQYIPNDDSSVFEEQPLERLAEDGQLYAYKHQGFWKCMDTLREKNQLNEMWEKGAAKWKVWK